MKKEPKCENKFKKDIAEKFYKGWEDDDGDTVHPLALTVKALKKFLDELPDDLPIGSFGEGYALVVFNSSRADIHLQLESPEDY